MRDRGVDSDDEIERLDRSGGLGEVGELRGEIDHFQCRVLRHIGGVRPDLQARKRNARPRGERRQRGEIERAAVVVGMLGPARPDQPDLEAAHASQPLAPARRHLGRRAQISHRRRDRLEASAEQARQAQQCAFDIGRRGRAAVTEKLDADEVGAHQCQQRLVHAEADRAGTRSEHRQVARELDGVAKALLGLHVDVPAGEAFALPRALRKARALDLTREQPPFVFVEALGEVAAHQQQYAEPGMGVGVLRRERERAAQRCDALLVAAGMVQRGTEIAPGIGEIGLERDGAAIGVDRLVVTLERVERVAEAVVRQGEIGRDRNGAAMTRRRLLVVLALVERGAEIAQRLRIARLERDRAPAGGDRLVDASGEPAHLAEIGLVERHVRRQRGRPLQMPDRLGEFSGLMRNERKDVQRVGLVGLRRENAAAGRLGIGEPPGAALLLGEREEIGDRHQPHVAVDSTPLWVLPKRHAVGETADGGLFPLFHLA